MSKNELMNKASRKLHRAGFAIKKHSPEILVVGGVVGVVTSAVMACKATTKLSSIIEPAKETIEQINKVAENPELYTSEEYTKEDATKDKLIVGTQTAVQVAKLYAPSVILGTLSIGAILASSNIYRKRNIALAAAYATIDKSFKDYRGRVIERFGNELDRELKYNLKSKEVKEQIVDEDGKKKTVKKSVEVVNPAEMYSEYSRFFDSCSNAWDKDPEINLVFLRQQQNYANELLQKRGHLFLNEVYDMLGLQRSKAGQVVGWIYDEKNPIGDNYVDFGIYNLQIEANRDFVNGYESVILLDFNVDGNILSKF